MIETKKFRKLLAILRNKGFIEIPGDPSIIYHDKNYANNSVLRLHKLGFIKRGVRPNIFDYVAEKDEEVLSILMDY